MTDVFISYASEDRERAGLVASALNTREWSIWWDRKIIVGQSFDQAIERELETAKSIVVLWSRNSISSEWVKNEAALAVERDVLVPALIDNVMLPLEFRRKQTADLVGWDGNLLHEGFQALCEGIAAKAGITGRDPKKSSTQLKRLRSISATLSSNQIDVMLVKQGFYDKKRNASGKGVAHRYEPQVVGDEVMVVDHATGLMWQKAGFGMLDLTDAAGHINRMNADKFAGFSDWRLPTLEEAMSLMEPQVHDNFHIDPVFQRGVNFLWTADRTSDGRGWVVYFHDGILAAEDIEFNAWARPVRSFKVSF